MRDGGSLGSRIRREVDLAGRARRDKVNGALPHPFLLRLSSLLLKHALVVIGHDTNEEREQVVEVMENTVGNLGTGVVTVVLDETTELSDLLVVCDLAERHHLHVDLGREGMRSVEDVRDSTAHTSSEVATSTTQDDDATTSHVLATVITGTLDDDIRIRVTNGETLGGDTTYERLSGGGTVEADVADDDVLFGLERRLLRRVDDETTTRETLSDVVIGVTLELDGDTGRREGTERLIRAATHADVDGIPRQTLLAVQLGDTIREGCAQSTVGVGDIALDVDRETLGESRLGHVDELVVEVDVELVVLGAHTVGRSAGPHLPSRLQDGAEVEVGCLRGTTLLVDLEHVSATNHLVDGPEAELGHVTTRVLHNVVEEVDDLLGLAGELRTQLWVLRPESRYRPDRCLPCHKVSTDINTEDRIDTYGDSSSS